MDFSSPHPNSVMQCQHFVEYLKQEVWGKLSPSGFGLLSYIPRLQLAFSLIVLCHLSLFLFIKIMTEKVPSRFPGANSGVLSQFGYPLTNISKTTPICPFLYWKCIFRIVPYTKKSFTHFHTL